jgi:agmatinase
MKKVDLSFQSCTSNYKDASVVIYSVPLDTTTSFRPGTRFAGNQIRVDSIGLEWYSPYQNLNLRDFNTCDVGDLELPMGDADKSLKIIYNTTKQLIKDKKFPMMVGGEHLASYAPIKALYEEYNDLRVIHFDAHTDLREEFLGRKFSHATFLRHCHSFLGDNKIFQFGIRSGDYEEFAWADSGHTTLHRFDLETLDDVIEKIKDYPVYITIDLDVLDPSTFPGTGTPEPGGITYKELLKGILSFKKLNHIVGADIMELAPNLDNTGASTMAAGKTLRELILLVQDKLAKN